MQYFLQQRFQSKTCKSDLDVHESNHVSAVFRFFRNFQEFILLFPHIPVFPFCAFSGIHLTAKNLFQGADTSTGWN